MIPISYVNKAGECVACKKEFTRDDDIVVCPECGAPHHRACWMTEGHCHYEVAHGTELEWHPKEQPEEKPAKESEEDTSSEAARPVGVFYANGIAMVKCPRCGKLVKGSEEEITCPRCGQVIEGVPDLLHQVVQPATPFSGQPVDSGEPIDGIESGKFARVILQKVSYYLPRFRQLKAQGSGIVSWNWSAFLLAPYWLAFRKCYLWSVFASFFDILSFVFMIPMTAQMSVLASEGAMTYSQMLEQMLANPPSDAAMMLGELAVMLLVARSVLFGLFGNYIYKKECIKRIQKLDAMPAEEAIQAAFKLGGVNVFMPLLMYYAISIVENIVLYFIS